MPRFAAAHAIGYSFTNFIAKDVKGFEPGVTNFYSKNITYSDMGWHAMSRTLMKMVSTVFLEK